MPAALELDAHRRVRADAARLRKHLGRFKDTERDQRVLVAFVEAIDDIDAGSYASVALQRATYKALFADRDAMDEESVPFDEELHTPTSPDGMTVAEIRVEAAWAARRAERAEALLDRTPAGVTRLASDTSPAAHQHAAA